MLARKGVLEMFSHTHPSSRADEMSWLACVEWEVLLLPVTEQCWSAGQAGLVTVRFCAATKFHATTAELLEQICRTPGLVSEKVLRGYVLSRDHC